ncbi:MAG: hypothetical protein LBL34_04985 [Clostridiales bacterium]|nr:hypothetical protein [Clostridiales bacterium]
MAPRLLTEEQRLSRATLQQGEARVLAGHRRRAGRGVQAEAQAEAPVIMVAQVVQEAVQDTIVRLFRSAVEVKGAAV